MAPTRGLRPVVAKAGYKAILVLFALAFAARSGTSLWERSARAGANMFGSGGGGSGIQRQYGARARDVRTRL